MLVFSASLCAYFLFLPLYLAFFFVTTTPLVFSTVPWASLSSWCPVFPAILHLSYRHRQTPMDGVFSVTCNSTSPLIVFFLVDPLLTQRPWPRLLPTMTKGAEILSANVDARTTKDGTGHNNANTAMASTDITVKLLLLCCSGSPKMPSVVALAITSKWLVKLIHIF